MSTHLPIFVINLASAAQRRAHMKQVLDKAGLAASFIPAVDGQSLDADTKAWWQADPLRATLNPGEVGCMLSHRNSWQRIVDQDLAGAVILEDDLILRAEFGDVLPALTEPLSQLGLIRLEGDHREVVIRRKPAASVAGHSFHLIRRDIPLSCGAYAVSRHMAQLLLAATPGFRVAVDAELFATQRSSMPDLDAYQLEPAICTQAGFDPALLATHPFLASTIAEFGDRADHRLGFKPRQQRRRKPQALRLAYRLFRDITLAPRGWRRLQVRAMD